VTRTLALIPAAGKSVRMGQPKLAMPVGQQTVLECVLSTLKKAGMNDILVVLGPHVAFLQDLVEKAGAMALVLETETPDMRTTALLGLKHLEKRFHPEPDDSWLLVPADHPTLDVTVIQSLLQARQQHPQASIFLPTYQGKRGHPTLIAWHHVKNLFLLVEGQGLNTYFRQHLSETCEIPSESPEVLLDLDTPEDYEKLQSRIRVV
jgi:molybdenum cofactor cytidylyltransferase